jgi:uncharacterized protein (DUF1800 family)
MRVFASKVALIFSTVLVGCVLVLQVAAARKGERPASSQPQMDEQKRALQALNRLTFGPRPGDIEHVLSMGVDKWIDQQLHPERIDDNALATRLAPFRTLRMSTREMIDNFPPQPLIKAVQSGKQPLPSDPAKRAIYQDQLQRLQARKLHKDEDAASGSQDVAGNQDKNEDESQYSGADLQSLLGLSPDERYKQVLQMSPEQRRRLSIAVKRGRRDELVDGMTPQQRETLMALSNPQQVVVSELVQAKLLRATYSERQLDEVMTDFWLNHFNVFIGKGADRYLLTSYERDVIRPHAMGKFEDLLVATAQSPAMLFYLDNWLSVGPNSDLANGVHKNVKRKRGASVKQAKANRSGLNENYGRELMELHTLGVDGGYTQKDVTELARVFTGWTLKRPREGGGFTFDARMHDPGSKSVLGHSIKSSGEKEGLEVLHILAHHPSTAKFISTKLAMRFVSDNPPPALVDRMAHTFLKKDGDIREVLKTMFKSPEFWSSDAYRAKVKTPFEFVVSSLRATGADVQDATPLSRTLQQLGMPLYGMQPPTGYSMKAAAWVNSSALLGRMNFALALASGRMKGVTVDSTRLADTDSENDPAKTQAVLENSLLSGDVSRQTHDTIAAQLQDPQITNRRLDDPVRAVNTGMIEALILGSPEFQRR